MVIFPNAKINIGLNILRRREDGYHEIETLFYPIGWKDALEYVENGGNSLNFGTSGINLSIDAEQNIIVKAYRLLQTEHLLPGLDIHLHKVIPSGAGLGGGSSDAAFFLKSLNDHFELGISPDHLRQIAARLGADCPFFLSNTPSYATGIGERLVPVGMKLSGQFLLLVKPPFGIDTRSAYAGVVPQPYLEDFREIISSGVENWPGKIKNDFEPSLFACFSELGQLKDTLIHKGASYASMSGSGSSVYGIFSKKPDFTPADFPKDSIIWMEELI